MAYKLTGIQGQSVSTKQEAIDIFSQITGEQNTLVLIISEKVSSMISSQIITWQKEGKFPLIVEVPGLNGHEENRKTLTDAIREAIGVQV